MTFNEIWDKLDSIEYKLDKMKGCPEEYLNGIYKAREIQRKNRLNSLKLD